MTTRRPPRSADGSTTGRVVAAGACLTLVAALVTGFVPVVSQVSDAFASSAIDVSPTTVDFGNVTVGAQSEQPVTVTNPSTGPQYLTGISLAGIPQNSPLRVDAAQCLELVTTGQALPSGGSCTIPVAFQPGATGTFTASFSLTGGSPSITQTVSISGTGVPVLATSTQLGSSANPSVPAQSVTFTATVSGVPGSSAPTGTVQFALDGTNLAAPVAVSPLSGPAGQAPQAQATSAPIPSLSTGAHAVTASYSGDSAYEASSATLTQTVAPVVVTSLSPTSGPSLGGTQVTIAGAGFTGATQVTFGGAPATFTVNSDTQITAISPGGQGTVDVIVTTPQATSTPTAADHYAYPSGCTAGIGFQVLPQPVDVIEGLPFTQLIAQIRHRGRQPSGITVRHRDQLGRRWGQRRHGRGQPRRFVQPDRHAYLRRRGLL